MDKTADQDAAKQLQQLSQNLANFIALYEQSDDKLKARQLQSENQIQDFSKVIDEQIVKINASLHDIAEIMSAAGAARWRIAAEQALKEGETHTAKLQQLINEFENVMNRNVDRLDRVTQESERRIAKLLSTISVEQGEVIENVRLRAEKSYQSINIVADETAKSFKNALLRVRMERFGIALITAILVTFLMGLYLNAEWPWETSLRAQQERNVGRAILNAWPSLSSEEQQHIKDATHLITKT